MYIEIIVLYVNLLKALIHNQEGEVVSWVSILANPSLLVFSLYSFAYWRLIFYATWSSVSLTWKQEGLILKFKINKKTNCYKVNNIKTTAFQKHGFYV